MIHAAFTGLGVKAAIWIVVRWILLCAGAGRHDTLWVKPVID
jgi:hypothetical protein